MGEFNKGLFGELLNKAKGNRSINNYAQRSGVDSAHISRLIRGKVANPPTPSTIKKLSDVAQNNISYKTLMIAAGHIDVDYNQYALNDNVTDQKELKDKNSRLDDSFVSNEVKKNMSFEEAKDEKDIAKRMKQIREDLSSEDGLSFDGEPMSEEAVESLLDAMEYAVRQTQRINKKYIPKKYRDKKGND